MQGNQPDIAAWAGLYVSWVVGTGKWNGPVKISVPQPPYQPPGGPPLQPPPNLR